MSLYACLFAFVWSQFAKLFGVRCTKSDGRQQAGLCLSPHPGGYKRSGTRNRFVSQPQLNTIFLSTIISTNVVSQPTTRLIYFSFVCSSFFSSSRLRPAPWSTHSPETCSINMCMMRTNHPEKFRISDCHSTGCRNSTDHVRPFHHRPKPQTTKPQTPKPKPPTPKLCPQAIPKQ